MAISNLRRMMEYGAIEEADWTTYDNCATRATRPTTRKKSPTARLRKQKITQRELKKRSQVCPSKHGMPRGLGEMSWRVEWRDTRAGTRNHYLRAQLLIVCNRGWCGGKQQNGRPPEPGDYRRSARNGTTSNSVRALDFASTGSNRRRRPCRLRLLLALASGHRQTWHTILWLDG